MEQTTSSSGEMKRMISDNPGIITDLLVELGYRPPALRKHIEEHGGQVDQAIYYGF